MAATTANTLRRDAAASIFAFGLAGLALLVQVTNTVLNHWVPGELSLQALDPQDRARTVVIGTADAPGWVAVALRSAEAIEWVAAGAVLVLLVLSVMGMLRGDVFAPSTARWVGWASWIVVILMLVAPTLLRLPATNMALQGHGDGWHGYVVAAQWWYLYVGAMTLSFVALVLRRGSQLQQDQAGLI